MYLTITALDPDALVGARIADGVAAGAELHMSMSADDDVASMHPWTASSCRPSQPVALEPGSYHVMLVDLAHPLEAGISIRRQPRVRRTPPIRWLTSSVRHDAP